MRLEAGATSHNPSGSGDAGAQRLISEESPKLVSPRGSAGASQRQPSVEDWHRDELERLRAEVAERDEALAAMHDLLNTMQPVPPEPAGPRERHELNVSAYHDSRALVAPKPQGTAQPSPVLVSCSAEECQPTASWTRQQPGDVLVE